MWIRQSFREDGQPSSPVSAEEQTLEGPLHEGIYAGQCLTREPLHVGMYTFAQAKEWAESDPQCAGFTFEHAQRRPEEPVRVVFKRHLCVQYGPDVWTYSLGRGM